MKQTIKQKHSYSDEIDIIIADWKKRKVDKAEFHFSCGGDSMNDTYLVFRSAKGRKLKIEYGHPLYDYFNKVVYDNVDFYEASDGHYIGESGIVYIELEDDESGFVFNKTSKSEYSENFDETAKIKLSKEQVAFINKYVIAIRGNYDEQANFVFNGDIVLSDEDERILKELENLIDNEVINYEFTQEIDTPYYGGGDWYTYTTNEEGEDLTIIDDNLLVNITREFIVYRED